MALQDRIVELQAALQRREGACVYGSPEIIEEYGRETQHMRDEIQALRKEMKDLDSPKSGKINNGATETLYGAPVPDR